MKRIISFSAFLLWSFWLIAQTFPNVQTFQKKVDLAGIPLYQADIIRTQDQGYAILARNSASASGVGYQVLKYDDNDQLEWSSRVSLGVDERALKLAEGESGYLILGNATVSVDPALPARTSPFLTQLDASGTVLYTHYFRDETYPVEASDFVWYESSDQVVIYGVEEDREFGDSFTVMLVDLDGNMYWRKAYQVKFPDPFLPNSYSYGTPEARDITGEDGLKNVLITGKVFEPGGKAEPILAKINLASGSLIWCKRYEFVSHPQASVGLYVNENADGSIYVVGQSTTTPNEPVFALKTNASGNFLWSKHYNMLFPGTVHQAGNTFYVGGLSLFNSGQLGFNLAKFDSNFDPIYVRNFDDPDCSFNDPKVSISSKGNELRMVRNSCDTNGDLYIHQTTPDATSACPVDVAPYSSTSMTIVEDDLTVDAFDELPVYYSISSVHSAPIPVESTICSGITPYNPNDYRIAATSGLSISPNPLFYMEGFALKFELPSSGEIDISIREILSWKEEQHLLHTYGEKGENHISIPPQELAAGTYLLLVRCKGALISQGKLMVK